MTREEKKRLLAEIEKQYKWLMTKSPTIYMMDIAFDAIRKAVRDEASQEPILEKIYADIQKLRGCSCSCSDGIIDDVEDILDKYKAESEET